MSEASSRFASILRRVDGNEVDLGVKNLPKRLGVTEDFRFSFCWADLSGEEERFIGDESMVLPWRCDVACWKAIQSTDVVELRGQLGGGDTPWERRVSKTRSERVNDFWWGFACLRPVAGADPPCRDGNQGSFSGPSHWDHHETLPASGPCLL